MSLRPFNSVSGFSVGNNYGVIDANGNVTSNSLTVASLANLGPISNVTITGGSAGQIIATDGNGNLSFITSTANSAAPMPYYVPTGESFIVPLNFQGLFAQPIEIDGVLEVNGSLIEVISIHNSNVTEIVFNDGNGYTSNAGFTFSKASGNLNIPGNVIVSTGNITTSGILTDNYYYANGQPFTSQKPSGSNTQLQYNFNNSFGASNNLTFNSDSNLLSIIGNVSITKNLQLAANSAISIGNNVGNAGQVLTSDGTNTAWATNFYQGNTPPDFNTLNYGDIFFFIDTPNNTQTLYMWVTDGSSSYFYDFLPPTF